jgi:hypothetical protein
MLRQSCGRWLRSQPVDTAQDVREQVPGDGDLCHLEGNVAPDSDNLAANLNQPVPEGRHRPVLNGIRQRQCAQEVAKILGKCM